MRGGLPLLAVLAILWSVTLPAIGNVPPGPHTIPKVQTECESYTSQAGMDRLQQWITTLQSGLLKNPQLEQDVWECVMDMEKVIVTDKWVYEVCKTAPDAKFEDTVFKALVVHLDFCGISVQR